jgi:ribose 5-phosphate isomerase B
MKIAIASDHIGFELKKIIYEFLKSGHYDCDDLGAYSPNPVDYPDIALKLAIDVAEGTHERGILICGTGIGMAIVANKVPSIRAALIYDVYSAERAMKSNCAQIVTLGALTIGAEIAKMLVEVWLKAEFAGGRSAPKVEKINRIDAQYRSFK